MIVQAVHGISLRRPSACLSACRHLKQVSLLLPSLGGSTGTLAALPDTLEYLHVTTTDGIFEVRLCLCALDPRRMLR